MKSTSIIFMIAKRLIIMISKNDVLCTIYYYLLGQDDGDERIDLKKKQ